MSDSRATLRQHFQTRRRQLNAEQRTRANQTINQYLCAFEPLRSARLVAAYAAGAAEVDIHDTVEHLWRNGQQVALPVIATDGHMDFYRYTTNTEVRKNRFGIVEPANGDLIAPAHIDIVLTPLVAFDGNGTRLGMGGGYYDRYLAQTQAYVLGVAYACQRSESLLPSEPWDMALNAVVTDIGVVKFPPL
jgi:5-formyltetrahydrofolate cyclo-ligase